MRRACRLPRSIRGGRLANSASCEWRPPDRINSQGCTAFSATGIWLGKSGQRRAMTWKTLSLTEPTTQRDPSVFGWIKTDPRRKTIQEDRQYVVGRTQRFLRSYLSADEARKRRFYEAIKGASAGCRPVIEPLSEDAQIARATAEAALEVVKRRSQRGNDGEDHLAIFITDAYATVAMAYHRAAGTYAIDQEMQQLGTAAVHLLTIATSYMTAHHPAEKGG
ncbi:hypothetical protein ACVI1J_005887 [Bradyrhizobium diazoefficiens]